MSDRPASPSDSAMRPRADAFSVGIALGALLFGLGFLIDFLTGLS